MEKLKNKCFGCLLTSTFADMIQNICGYAPTILWLLFHNALRDHPVKIQLFGIQKQENKKANDLKFSPKIHIFGMFSENPFWRF